MRNFREAYLRWQNKKVYNKIKVFDAKDKTPFTKINGDKFDYEASFSTFEGRDVVKIEYKPDLSTSRRTTIGIKIPLDKFDLKEFNRVRVSAYVKAVGFRNLFMVFSLPCQRFETTHDPSLKTNNWEDVIWEVNHLDLGNLKEMSIIPFMGGRPSEGNNLITLYIENVYFEKVDKEYELGYDIDNRIAYSQLGYFPNSKKEFIVESSCDSFEILKNKEVVYSGKTHKVATSLGNYAIGDFSEIKEIGKYQIKVSDIITPPFMISNNPYIDGMKGSLDFLYQLRCGVSIPHVHSACHLNSRTYNDSGAFVPNFGGWYDAGDLSQFEIPTAEICAALYELYFSSKTNRSRILEEATIGSDWLLRTTFHNGERALAVLYEKWHDVLQDDKFLSYVNKSENGPFENFLSSNALALASLAYEAIDEVYSDYALRVAIEDYEFAKEGLEKGIYSKRWGPTIVSQTYGCAILASCNLYKATLDKKYLINASYYAESVIACQETNFIGNSKIRGFFYEDIEHKYILSYEHRGHEEYVTSGLVELARLASGFPDYPKWVASLNLYREYILSTIEYTQPYNFLPGHIYFLDKININHFTVPSSYGTSEEAIEILNNQIKEGIKITDNCYLRRMPIAIQRRGFLATLLSKTIALTSIANFFNDEKLKQIAIYQLEYVHGRNPFATSFMYGVGYNYHPLYVAYSLQMKGSLPVGVKTYQNSDKPYWPAYDDAVFKEIWGHTTGKYLYVLADLLKNE